MFAYETLEQPDMMVCLHEGCAPDPYSGPHLGLPHMRGAGEGQ